MLAECEDAKRDTSGDKNKIRDLEDQLKQLKDKNQELTNSLANAEKKVSDLNDKMNSKNKELEGMLIVSSFALFLSYHLRRYKIVIQPNIRINLGW